MTKIVAEVATGNGQAMAAPTPSHMDTRLDFGAGLGSIESVRAEISECFGLMRDFCNTEPDEVMRYVSGWHARFGEIRQRIYEIEVVHRQWRPIRTNEIEPIMQDLKTQYDIASRLVSVRELDWRIETSRAVT